jgi:hypothetical protein
MPEGNLLAIGPCFLCKSRFQFDPDRVTSVFIDPVTGLPPDLAEDGTPKEMDREALARSVRRPLCPSCIDLANEEKERRGEPKIPYEQNLPFG